MRIYFDCCCYNRPFDDLTQLRVRLEAEAVLAILRITQSKGWTLISSDVIELEISNMTNAIKRSKINELCHMAHERIITTDSIAVRADELQLHGIKTLDSFHVAIAEHSNVDILLTTDDKLESLASKIPLSIKITNPLKWLPEVL